METVAIMVTENFESPALESLPFEELGEDEDFQQTDISTARQDNKLKVRLC